MGLFDFFKKDNNDEEMVKITDFFSPEDMSDGSRNLTQAEKTPPG